MVRRLVVLSLVASGCFGKPQLGEPRDGGGDDATDGSDAPPADAPVRCNAIDVPGLLAYYSFDSASEGVVSDGVTGELDGTLQMAKLADGKTGAAVRLAAPTAGVYVGAHDDVTNLAAISVCAWLRLDHAQGQLSAIVVDKSKDGTDNGWQTYLNELGLTSRVAFYTPYHAYAFGQTVLPIDAWVHICTTWDGTAGVGGISLYVAGAPEGVAQSGAGLPARDSDLPYPLMIGRQPMMNGYTFPGSIDELVLYERVLTSAEVFDIYSCPTTAQ